VEAHLANLVLLAFGAMAVVGWALWLLSHPATTILYRAVGDAERRDILSDGRFRTVGHSMEGKWLAEERAHARAWGSRFYPREPFWIVAVTLRASAADALYRSDPNLDQIGPARYAELEQLDGAMINVVEEVQPS
jgi:hypothetical protein